MSRGRDNPRKDARKKVAGGGRELTLRRAFPMIGFMDKNLPAEPAPAGKSGAWPTGVMNAIRDVAGLIVCIFLSFVALLPVSGFVLFKKPWAAVVLAACGAALYWFHRRPSRFAPAIQAAFYGLVGVNLALAAALLFVASPLIFPIAAAAGVLHHFLAKRWGPHRALMLFAFAIVIFLLVALPFNLKMLVGLIFIAILIPLLLRGAERAPSLLASSAIVTAICVGAFAVSFYYGFFPKETAKGARQPGMRLLVDPRLIEKSQHSDRQMFAAKSCDRTQVLIGSESGAWVKHPTGPRLMEQVLDYRVGDQLVYDCANNAAWLGMYAPGGIVKLGPDFRVAQIFPAPGRAVTNLRQAGRLLLGGDDMSTDGVVFDLASQSFRPALRGVGSRDLLWDPRSNQTIGATAFFVRWSDLPTGRVPHGVAE